MEDKETFRYTYSAARQEEVEAIRRKYLPAGTQADKMEQLRRLDASVAQKATSASLASGILGALVLGCGMSLIMTDLGRALSPFLCYLLGMLLGLVGIAGIFAAYPLHRHITQKERQRIAPQILALAQELSQ